MKSLILTCCLSFSFATYFFAHDTLSPDEIKRREKLTKKFLKEQDNYVYIPTGSYGVSYCGDCEYIEPRTIDTVNTFFMLKSEVSNFDYLEFLRSIQTTDTTHYRLMLPDTTVWRAPYSYNEPYVEYYLRHPAYWYYPLVGVSHYQARAFCVWLTDMYHQQPERIFKKVLFRLPTEMEWVYAAEGGTFGNPFPWQGFYSEDENGKPRANCMRFSAENIYYDTLYQKTPEGQFKPIPIYRASNDINYEESAGMLHDYSDVTVPCISYSPNEYGLYNMAGNLAEMVQELGITHGGSWNDPGAYMRNHVRQFYVGEHSSSSKRGFRVVMEVLEW